MLQPPRAYILDQQDSAHERVRTKMKKRPEAIMQTIPALVEPRVELGGGREEGDLATARTD